MKNNNVYCLTCLLMALAAICGSMALWDVKVPDVFAGIWVFLLIIVIPCLVLAGLLILLMKGAKGTNR